MLIHKQPFLNLNVYLNLQQLKSNPLRIQHDHYDYLIAPRKNDFHPPNKGDEKRGYGSGGS